MAEVSRQLTRSELDTVIDWAAAEGWNPGNHDAAAFWDADPQGYSGIVPDEHLVGAIAAVAYGRDLGFIGLFIVRPESRGQGLGSQLWHEQVARLAGRLNPNAPIGLDGVITMTDFYERSGFVRSHDSLRMAGSGPGEVAALDGDVVPLAEVAFDELVQADAHRFGARRDAFLHSWLSQPGTVSWAVVRDGQLRGYGVRRPCRVGHKIGPLFAESAQDAGALLAALRASLSAAEPFTIDVPECNAAGMTLAAEHGFTEVFRCVRMYRGDAPDVAWNQVYGVTSFELG